MARQTLTGFDCETLETLERIYNKFYLEEVETLLELTIVFHSDPNQSNLFRLEKCLEHCKTQLARREGFRIHNDKVDRTPTN